MGKINIFKHIDTIILIIVLVWVVILATQLWRVKDFELNHKMLIQNRLDTQDIVQGRTLEAINAEAYKNAYELCSELIVPSLILSMVVLGVCFMLSEISWRNKVRGGERP